MRQFLSVLVVSLLVQSATSLADDDVIKGTPVSVGTKIDLLRHWPAIAKAPKSDLATIELLIKPDAVSISRPRAFLITLSNAGGSDVAGISLTLWQGAPRVNALGTKLNAPSKLAVGKWSHLAMTINTKSINKQVRLWVNGKLVADELVLTYWPNSFHVAEMMSDHWNQGRVFTGILGDVRISRRVRYVKDFPPPTELATDDNTVLHFAGGAIPAAK